MKKISHLSGLVFMVLWAVVFVTATSAAPYSYKGDKPIYPAVYQAIMNGSKSIWNESKATVPDPNTVVIERVKINDLLNVAEFTLTISLENNIVTYKFSDIKERPQTSKTDWKSVDKFVQKDREQIFTSHFDKEIPKVMENEALYSKAKEAADKSLGGPPGGGALSYSLALQNPQKYLLYPAVGAAFNSVKDSLGAKTAFISDLFCLDNEFIIKNCFGVRGPFNYIKYNMKINYQGDQLKIDFTDVESGNDMLMIYTDIEISKIPRFDTQKLSDQIKTQIEKSLATADEYNAARKAFLENNNLLYYSLHSLTSMMKDDFTAKVLKSGDVSFNATVLDVKKNDSAEFKNYTAVISASLRTEGYSPSTFAYVYLYTNDSSLTRLKSGEKVMLSGKLVRFEEKMTIYYFTLTK